MTIWIAGKTMTALRPSRRSVLAGMGAAGLLLGAGRFRAAAQQPDTEMLFNDPDVPTGGNAEGGLTIITFFDYNCPFCKRAALPLDKVVREDDDIRLVYKDWPILTEASVVGAQLALAAHRQGRYEQVHHALMGIEGRRVEVGVMKAAIEAAGLDASELEQRAQAEGAMISGLLGRNMDQADMIGLRGTPAYIVGPFLVASALDEAGFRQVVKDARERMKG